MTKFAPGTQGSTFTLALAGYAVRAVKRVFVALKNRQEVASLYELDDRALKDIGLMRTDVHAAMASPLLHDPSIHLASVAGDKRAIHSNVTAAIDVDTSTRGMSRVRHAASPLMHHGQAGATC